MVSDCCQDETPDSTGTGSAGSAKNVFGIMQVSKPPYQDPTTNAANWLAIDFEPIKTFEPPISLGQIKAEPTLQNMSLQ
ncbi:MAG: EVE domain-containing protein [Bacteroidota bacterium]